jgi:serine/threonine protein kinase
MNHPFIINMHYSFQDKDNLYIIMDLLTGGDLRYHLTKQKKFTEEQTSKNIFIIIK